MCNSGGVYRLGAKAHQLVLFKVVPGSLHINHFLGRELGADLEERCGAGRAVLVQLELKSLFQNHTPWAIHGYTSSIPPEPRVAEDVFLLPLLSEDLLLCAEPILLVLAGFATTDFVQLVGPRSYHVL